MFCPGCGTEVGQEDAFCASCGRKLGVAETVETPAQQADPPGTPARPASPPDLPAQQAGPPDLPAQHSVGTQPLPAQVSGYGNAPSPVPGSGAGKAFAWIVVVVLVLGVAGAAAAWFLLPGDGTPSQADSAGSTTPATPPDSPTAASGSPATPEPRFATPGEAVQSEIPPEWVYELIADTPDEKEYWAGPPQSEFASALVVEPAPDGGWQVREIVPMDVGGDVPVEGDESARYTVEEFLYAVMDDRAEDAHSLTIPPFSEDPASASFGGGDFTGFTVETVEHVGDGTYWVYTAEEWVYGVDYFRYHVVSTESGWRIQDAQLQ